LAMKILRAFGFHLLASLAVLIFVLVVGIGGGTMGPEVFLMYGIFVAFAFPLWLLAFLPLFIWAAPESKFWRWYVALPLGTVLGFLAGLLEFRVPVDLLGGFEFGVLRSAPAIFGFALFLFGAVSKIRSNDESLSN